MAAVLWFLASAVFVDLVGYWLHRMSHRPWSGPMFRAHMTHHVTNYPPRSVLSDRYRSSHRDSLAIWFAPFGAVYVLIVWLGLPHEWAILAGGALTAFLSSYLHDKTHIIGSFVWRVGRLKGIAVRHSTHHFKMGRNFGIIVDWWDRLFRTRRLPAASLEQRLRRHREHRPPSASDL